MPIKDDLTIEYNIPKEIKKRFTKEIMSDFRKKTIEVFKQNDINQEREPSEYEQYSYCNWWTYMEGTSGFDKSFRATCEKYNLHDVVSYYDQLPWYDADLFDSEFGDLLVDYGLVELGTPDEDEDYDDDEEEEDKELARIYGEGIEKVENGENVSFEVKSAEELFNLIENDKE